MEKGKTPEDFAPDESAGSNGRLFMAALWSILGVTVLTGIFLAVYYIPTFAQAFSSVERLNDQVPFGWMIRRAHAVGGNLLLLLAILQFLRLFVTGDYKGAPRNAWLCGALFLGLATFAAFTGSFLPLSQQAFWGTSLVLSSAAAIPSIGGGLADFLRGGKELGGNALIRFYSLHIGFAVIMVFLLYWHDRLMAGKEDAREEKRYKRIRLAWIAVGLLAAGVTFIPSGFSDPLKEIANPLINPDRMAPPWYFLFLEETLKFFSGVYPGLGWVIFVLFPLLVLFLPWVDRSRERGLLLRPVALSIGGALVIILVYFTLIGTANARYGQKVVIPERPLTAAELQGARVYGEKNCAYCHQIFGREGRREGPDMSVVVERGRSPEWIRRFTLNARIYQPGTTMPRYEMPLEDLEALSQYILSLDVRKNSFRAVPKKEFLDYGAYLFVQGAEPQEGKK